jgi:hypothetical protein
MESKKKPSGLSLVHPINIGLSTTRVDGAGRDLEETAEK